jgi:hypothetical protein
MAREALSVVLRAPVRYPAAVLTAWRGIVLGHIPG